MFRQFALIILASVAMVPAARAQLTTSHQIPYQGRLELDGVPMNGLFNFRFELYSSPAGGDCLVTPPPNSDCLWAEELTDVAVVGGSFSVVLGSAGNLLGDEIWQNENVYLGIRVAAQGDNYTKLTGRQRILTVPMAARADTAKNYRVTGDLQVDGNVLDRIIVRDAEGDTLRIGNSAGSGPSNRFDLMLLSGNQLYVTAPTSSFSGVVDAGQGVRFPNNVTQTVAGQFAEIRDFGMSNSSYTSRTSGLKIAYGQVYVAENGTATISNLPFTSSTSYTIVTTLKGWGQQGINGWAVGGAEPQSGSAANILNHDNVAQWIFWMAIGY